MNSPQLDSPTLEALRRVTEARQILEDLVISSETFDYRKAKQALNDLQRMIRELGREEARLRAKVPYGAGAQVLPFPTQRSAS